MIKSVFSISEQTKNLNHRDLEPYSLPEDKYLNGELSCEFKNEYINNIVYPMPDIAVDHNRITSNTMMNLHRKNPNYDVFNSMMKLKIGNDYFYPDVGCYLEDKESSDYQTLPIVLVEIISDESKEHDLIFKLAAYKTIPSLQEYIILEVDTCCMHVYKKADNWQESRYFLGDTAYIEAIDLNILVEDVYLNVKNKDMLQFSAQNCD